MIIYGSSLLSRGTHLPLPSLGTGVCCSSYKSFKWDVSQSWQLLCTCTDVAVITKQSFYSLKSLLAFHIIFRIATELYKACATKKDSQCCYLVISTISVSVVMHCQDYRWQINDWGDRLGTRMEVSSFSSMSLFPFHLLLVLRVLLMFCNWTTQAQLQWLGRVGLGLWGTGDLFKRWNYCLLPKLLPSSNFLEVHSPVLWERGFWGPQAGALQEQECQESGVPNPAAGKPCCSWGKDAGTFPCQILPPVLAPRGEVLCPAELCARCAWGTEPRQWEGTRDSLVGDILLPREAETFWPVLLHDTCKKLGWPAQFLEASWKLEVSLR